MDAVKVDSSIAVFSPTTIDVGTITPIKFNYAWCKSCDICSALCPQCVIEPDRDRKPVLTNPEACTQCGICWTHCPDSAITSNVK